MRIKINIKGMNPFHEGEFYRWMKDTLKRRAVSEEITLEFNKR